MLTVFALSLAANQAACGLALTILALACRRLLASTMSATACRGSKPLSIPLLSDIPVIGPVLFHQDAVVVYLSLAAFALVAWTLAKTGWPVAESGGRIARGGALAIRCWPSAMVAVWRAMAGLARAYLSTDILHPRWVQNMSAGRGWIAVALVVFTAWKPGRLLLGAYLFGVVTIPVIPRPGPGYIALPV